MFRVIRPVLPSFVRPISYNLKLRSGVKNVIIQFEWDGGGSVQLELVSPTKTYTEEEMKITDKTSIHANGRVACKYIRKYELSIPKLSQEEIWTLKLNLQNLYSYHLNIEASSPSINSR